MVNSNSVVAFTPRSGSCKRADARVDCEHCKVRLVSICAALEDDELAFLENIAHPVCFGAKETLFIEGEATDAAYSVTSGMLRVYRVFHDGRRQVLGFLVPGDFMGIAAEGLQGFSADAISPVTLCRFGKREFSALVDTNPSLLHRLRDTAEHELEVAREHIMALGQRSACERVAWFLVHLRSRWAQLNPASETVAIPMPRQDIADYLGLTIETVSRTLSQLARDKAIEIVPDGARITDVKRIEQLAAT